MNRAVVSRIISSIPERCARAPSGSAFSPEHTPGDSHERVARLSRHLQWLGPLSPLTKDEQRDFGLGPAHARPADNNESADEPESQADGHGEVDPLPPVPEDAA
jgi:hypothetical protein